MSLIDYTNEAKPAKGLRFKNSAVQTEVLGTDAKAGDIVATGVVAATYIDGHAAAVEYKAGEAVPVITQGWTIVEAGATVAAGDTLYVATGKVNTTDTNPAFNGKALEAGVSGDFIKVQLF